MIWHIHSSNDGLSCIVVCSYCTADLYVCTVYRSQIARQNWLQSNCVSCCHSGHLHACDADSLKLTDVAEGVWSSVWSWHLCSEERASKCINLSSETSPTPELHSVSTSPINTKDAIKYLVKGLYWVAWQLILHLSIHLHILHHVAGIVLFFPLDTHDNFWQIYCATQSPQIANDSFEPVVAMANVL